MTGGAPSSARLLLVALRAAFFAGCFFWFWAWLALSVRSYDANLGGPLPAWPAVAGWALVALGVPLTLTCVALFVVRGRGTPAPFDPPREFVASGPYRLVRNPMYLGALAILAGSALILRSPSVVLLAVVFIFFFHLFVLVYEEPTLERGFGESYREYKRSVGRWLPKWRRR